jgi:hypothetical protein
MRGFRVSQRLIFIAILALGVSATAAYAQAQPVGPRKGYQVLRAFPDRFTCEYPAKDWDVVPGGAASIVALSQKKREATIVVEYQPMQLELAPSEIDDNFAKLEVEPISTRQSGVSGMTAKIQDINGHKAIVIEYTRRGATGPEHVRQYSLPMGKHLYRVIGSAPTSQFERYAPAFEVAASSFAIAGAPAPAPAAQAPPKQ